MKKKRLFTALFGAVAIAAMCGAMTACATNSPEDPTPTPTPEPEQQAAITDGVFTWVLNYGGKDRVCVLKFKEDGTWYGNDMTEQERYVGKYEVIENTSITYIKTGVDGYVNFKRTNGDSGDFVYDENGVKIVATSEDGVIDSELDIPGQIATKGIRFFEMDGVTPYTIADKDHYLASEVSENYNVLAWDQGCIWNVHYNNTYVRTVTHHPDQQFGLVDEVRAEEYVFMASDLSELEWIASNDVYKDFTKQDCTFTVYNNTTYQNRLTEIQEVGTYVVSESVYTLTKDDATSGGKLTIASDGKSATYEVGSTTIHLVPYAPAAEVVTTLTGEASLYSGAVTMNVKIALYEDGTAKFLKEDDTVVFEGTWAQKGDGSLDLALGTLEVTASAYDKETKTATVSLSGQFGTAPMEGTLTGTIESVNLFASLKGEAKLASVDYKVGDLTLNLYDNNRCEIINDASGTTLGAGVWAEQEDGSVSVEIEGFTVTASSYDKDAKTATVAISGNLGGTDIVATLTGEISYVTAMYNFAGVFNNFMNLTLTCYSDNTWELIAAVGANSIPADHGTWSGAIQDGSIKMFKADGTEWAIAWNGLPGVTWAGNVATQNVTDTVLTLVVPQ